MTNCDVWCGMFIVIFTVVVLSVAPLIPISHASDFIVDAQCVSGHWYVTIHDENNGIDNEKHLSENTGIIQGVSIRTIPSIGSSNVKSTFETDKSGSFFLAPEYNTGWVWLSKPGYNDQKVRSSCDTAYDAFSYSEQFASYCYDYVYQFIPMTFLPEMAHTLPSHTIKHVMDFFDAQITSRDETITMQTLEIKALLDFFDAQITSRDETIKVQTLETNVLSNTLDNNASIIHDMISNSTKDEICLLHIDDAISEAYERVGILHINKSGMLKALNTTSMQSFTYDDINVEKMKLDGFVNMYCSNTTLETAQKIQIRLDVLDVLYEEQRRQVYDLQYMLLMDMLSDSQSSSSPHQPSSSPPQSPLQNYYYYNNNYYLDSSHYHDSNNDRRDFYYYDATGSKPYDYTKHDRIKNYNPKDHDDHDHSHTNCITFCDKNDYEPIWARYLDKYGAREACWDVDADPKRIGTADWYWCKDLGKYLYNK